MGPRRPFLTSPLAPRVEMCPLGAPLCSLCSPARVNTLCCLDEWGGEQRISPPGDNFTPGGQSLPLGAKLSMGLSFSHLEQERESFCEGLKVVHVVEAWSQFDQSVSAVIYLKALKRSIASL
jgi:hypothetical protein